MNELTRRITVANQTVEEDLSKVMFLSFISGSTAINHNISNDVDVVLRADTITTSAALEAAGWAAAGLYPGDLWRSFKKTVYGVPINILLCRTEGAYLRAWAALKACIAARGAGVEVDKTMRIYIHAAIMGDKH